ncbi:MAG: hypothetical protein Q9220_004440 [cf. Caloplaca sp. 1 TL-2023]
MIFNKFLVALALSTSLVSAQGGKNNRQKGGNKQGAQNAGQGNATDTAGAANDNTAATKTTGNNAQAVLNPANIQTGSAQDGQGQVSGVAAGQAASATDAANFINFCTGKTLTNGLQVKGGSCNGIPMGDIPATTNMVSTILTNPVGGCIQANKDFDVTLQVANLNAGVFTNPTVTYYTAPQALKNGNIVGHVHVTIQDLGANLTPDAPLDASVFVFFKGIDDAGDGKGGLKVTVTGGLPAGNFRVCTMSAAANHQPVTMPVAQRGAQDDCVRFITADNCAAAGGGNANAGGNAASGSTGSSSSAADAGSSSTSAAASSSTGGAASAKSGGGQAQKGRKAQQGQQQGQEQQQQQEQGRRFGRYRDRMMRHRFQNRGFVG